MTLSLAQLRPGFMRSACGILWDLDESGAPAASIGRALRHLGTKPRENRTGFV
jgi:hypothetical protein